MAIPKYDETKPITQKQETVIKEEYDPYSGVDDFEDSGSYGDANEFTYSEMNQYSSNINADDDSYDPYVDGDTFGESDVIYNNPEWGTYTPTKQLDSSIGQGGQTNISTSNNGSSNPANTTPKPSNITVSQLKRIFKLKKYKWIEPFQLIGVRNADKPNNWNDTMLVVYDDIVEEFECTTKPGVYYLKKLLNSKGCSILKEGQFTYKLGYHKQTNSARYRALNPTYNLPVHRDPTKNGTFHYNINSSEGGGINIHSTKVGTEKSSPGSGVKSWSAGCQVIHYWSDFQRFMSLCEKYRTKLEGGIYQYTLLNASDF